VPNSFSSKDFVRPYRAIDTLPDDVAEAVAGFMQKGRLHSIDNTLPDPDGRPQLRPTSYFEIYRADRVALDASRFTLSDWHWRFHSSNGDVIATSDTYDTEAECAASVTILRDEAASALVRSISDAH
jgi:uncharacterized protein YegP (UPF0339 family)